MCGIVGYIGKKESLPIILAGLQALEYRGYDSAGVVICNDKKEVSLAKSPGYVQKLVEKTRAQKMNGGVGIGHTRWATHGAPTEKNVHPHHDCAKRIFVVHNGIIENYKELKNYLQHRGHEFSSETDTEIMAHLMEEFLRQGRPFTGALFSALRMIDGTYAFGIIDKENPSTLYAARLSSPLVVGVGEGENYLASDPSALITSTKK